jgi:hypothetical protein
VLQLLLKKKNVSGMVDHFLKNRFECLCLAPIIHMGPGTLIKVIKVTKTIKIIAIIKIVV